MPLSHLRMCISGRRHTVFHAHSFLTPPLRHVAGSIGKGIGAVFSLGISTAKQWAHKESYFSVRIRADGKNYIVCCGSTVCSNRCNKAGIQIRHSIQKKKFWLYEWFGN